MKQVFWVCCAVAAFGVVILLWRAMALADLRASNRYIVFEACKEFRCKTGRWPNDEGMLLKESDGSDKYALETRIRGGGLHFTVDPRNLTRPFAHITVHKDGWFRLSEEMTLSADSSACNDLLKTIAKGWVRLRIINQLKFPVIVTQRDSTVPPVTALESRVTATKGSYWVENEAEFDVSRLNKVKIEGIHFDAAQLSDAKDGILTLTVQ